MHAGDSPRARRHPAQHTRNGFGHREATSAIWQCHICYVWHHREYNITITDINNIEILRVDLNGISVTAVYKPPGERFSFHQPLTAVGDQQQVIIGDFNSHSSTCGYATTNTDGELVEDWADNHILSMIHDPKLPSSFNSGRWRPGYNPDIIFATNRIGGCCNKICDRTNTTLQTSTYALECKWMQLSPFKPYISGDDST